PHVRQPGFRGSASGGQRAVNIRAKRRTEPLFSAISASIWPLWLATRDSERVARITPPFPQESVFVNGIIDSHWRTLGAFSTVQRIRVKALAIQGICSTTLLAQGFRTCPFRRVSRLQSNPAHIGS